MKCCLRFLLNNDNNDSNINNDNNDNLIVTGWSGV